jgi:gamma-glutamyltranspeptidase/glutathione hydrolase
MEHFTSRPELSGTFGAVASTHWIASACGMKLLEAGGNAFDAAVAAGFVLQIVEPHLNGPGGDVPILASRYHDSAPTVICGQGGAPAAATIEAFESLGLDLIPGTGLLAACVPGAFGAWLTLLRDWGTVSLRSVLQPAIEYALHGHPILTGAVETIRSVQQLFLEEWKTSASVFLRDGAAPAPGALFSNRTLGELYAAIIDHAESAATNREAQIEAALSFWYEGPVAAAIDRFARNMEAYDVSGQRHRGLLTGQDLNGWRPPIEPAVSIDYREHVIFKCGPWSQGPVMLQALRILEGFDLAALEPEGPEFVHLVAETLKLAIADREAWYGDEPDVPLKTLLSREYAAARRSAPRPAWKSDPVPSRGVGPISRRCGLRSVHARVKRRPAVESQRSDRACRRRLNAPATRVTSTSSIAGATWCPRRPRAGGCSPVPSYPNWALPSARACKCSGCNAVTPTRSPPASVRARR